MDNSVRYRPSFDAFLRHGACQLQDFAGFRASPMKIAYLARRPIPSMQAHAVQIVTMCEAFGKLGHELMLYALRGDADPATTYARYGVDQRFGIEVFPRVRRFKKTRFAAWLLRHKFPRQADLFFGRDITSLAAASLLGRPLVYEAHTIPPINSYRWRLLSWMFARPNFSHLVCVTSTLADLHREQFPALAGKPVLVVPNAGAELPVSPFGRAWPGRADTIQVGFVGRPYPGKGIEMMVDAARQLPGLDFHVVGATEADLHWMTGGMPTNIHFRGYQPHGELGAFFKRFDIAAAPYGKQVMSIGPADNAAITSPLKLIEYMAAGLPSIVSDLPGVRDMVCGGDEVTLIVPPGDLGAFVAALRRLADDSDLRTRFGKAARQRYLAQHTSTARARTVLGSLENVRG